MMKYVFIVIVICSLASTSFSQQNDIPENFPLESLVAWWPFNTNADDQTQYGHHGQVVGAKLTSDRFNHKKSAYTLDGFDDYISVEVFDESMAFSNQFTISAWLNPVHNFKDQYIFSQGDGVSLGFALLLRKSGELVFQAAELDGPFHFTARMVYNSWTHVTLVVENGSARLYTNGEWVATFILPMGIMPSNLPFVMGSRFPLSSVTPILGNGFCGKLDDVAIWNRAFLPEEIKSLIK